MGRKGADLLSGVFWLACGLGLCVQAVRLGIGRLSDPGPGFTLFLAAGFLALFSVVLVFSSLWLPGEDAKSPQDVIQWGNIGLIFLALAAYGLALTRIGFTLSTFLLVAGILRGIERKNWHVALLCAAATALGMYALFELWLQARLPKGVWGF